MAYKYILFDLDGTLTDPKEGITNSVAHALRSFGIEPPPADELCPFIGPPLAESFMKFYGFDELKAQAAVDAYREYFDPHGKFENLVYDGIEDMLKKLCDKGIKLAVATSKPEKFAIQILEHFGIAGYFDIIRGSLMDGGRVHKNDVINSILDELTADEKANIIMVGDRKFDIIGAHECGMGCIGVLFGYGSREELTEAGADFIVEDVAQLTELLLG